LDEIILTIAPVLLGEGLRLFGGSLTEERWNLKNVVAYKNGFVELSYFFLRNGDPGFVDASSAM
jgi:dihydrofolate reductase